MTIYYIASLARYELVEAESEQEAITMAAPKLPGPVMTVRLARPDEIGLQAWNDAKVAEEEKRRGGGTGRQ